MIALTKMTSTEIFTYIAVLVFKSRTEKTIETVKK